MENLPYSIIDVFSSVPYKGNPLAVVYSTSNSLTKTQMQLIARQFNLSETTFICPPQKPTSTYRLRSFLPNGEEVFGAGHNSLGAWWQIVDSGLVTPSQEKSTTKPATYHQELGDAVLPIEVSHIKSSRGDEITISMTQGPPQFLSVHPDPSSLAEALGIQPAQIGFEYAGGSLSAARVVTTSPARHLLVPIPDRETLHRIDFSNVEALTRELEKTESYNSGVYAFTPVGTGSGSSSAKCPMQLEARFFSPGMGMEDPATGSAAGPLAALLCDSGVVRGEEDGNIEIQVLQGLKKGRHCVMRLTVQTGQDNAPAKVSISGTAVLVAEGNITVPLATTAFQ